MEAHGGLGIILENRYYGASYPFASSTTDELRFLTMEQAIADNAYFAQHAAFPGVEGNGSLCAPNSPWILYGGSLAGAQTAYSVQVYGGGEGAGVLWGGVASSGTTHAVLEYPEWCVVSSFLDGLRRASWDANGEPGTHPFRSSRRRIAWRVSMLSWRKSIGCSIVEIARRWRK